METMKKTQTKKKKLHALTHRLPVHTVARFNRLRPQGVKIQEFWDRIINIGLDQYPYERS